MNFLTNLFELSGIVSLLVSFLLIIHHYHIHGYWYDKNDLRRMKVKSHEFWIIFFTVLSFIFFIVSRLCLMFL